MSRVRAATQDEIRRHNLARVVRRLHLGGPASRSDLVAITGLNRSTVGALVTELAQFGLVDEEAGSGGGIGRPSLVVVPVPASAVAVAFDLRVERTVAALVGLGGTVFERRELPHGRKDFSAKAAARHLAQLAADLLEAAPRHAAWIGTGVGVPGVIDHTTGLIRVAPNLNWVDAPLGALVEEAMGDQFGVAPPTIVGNDADLGAIAEHARGAGTGHQNVVYLSGEVGIGGGFIVDGRLMAGGGGYGGEVGHMVVKPGGHLCVCGNRGCWETEVGRDALLRATGRSTESGDIVEVLAAAASGDAATLAGIAEVGQWLGMGLSNLVNMFNPEVIVLGGHFRHLLPYVRSAIDDQIGRALRANREQVQIVASSFDGDSTLIGAAEVAFQGLLDDPVGSLTDSAVSLAG